MVEVKPTPDASPQSAKTIGQVVLKRLMSAEQVVERLTTAPSVLNLSSETSDG